MPPKKAQASKSDTSKQLKGDNVDETPLQAVVLADSYNRRFEVLCTDQPRVLLPLCSTPLLAWTLESLAMSKVKQVFIFCGVHADKIRGYVQSSPYSTSLDIVCLSSRNARSAGDALRELDDMHLLNPDNPFILVHSPLISNYDISRMVDAHKKRRETDKNFIMTMGVGKGGRRHPESPIMLVNPESSRLLHYVLNPISPTQHRVFFPLNHFVDPYPATMDTYEVWSGPSSSSRSAGYRDLGVDICEADVPALCTENFDYHDLRRHFVNGVLTSELLGKKIAVHLVGENEAEEEGKDVRAIEGGRYIDRVRDTRTYGDITRDVLRRWVFPLVPDINEPGGMQYELRRGNIYVARDNVMLSRTTSLRGPLLIGPRSSLSDNTVIHQSTLGAVCAVGANTKITMSYIFSNVTIGANCVLEECMVGDGVVLADGVKIGRGALIGNGVKLGKSVIVPEFARIGAKKYRPDDWDEEDDEMDGDDDSHHLAILGPDSVGYVWPNEEEEEPDSDSEDDADDPYEHPRNKRLLQLGRNLSDISLTESSLSTLSKASTTPPDSPATLASDVDIPVAGLNLNTGPPPAFHAEASASLERAFDENHTVDNALLELRTLVMGYNAGIDSAREEVVKFIMSKISLTGGAAKILENATKLWARWGPITFSLRRDTSEIALDVQAFCASQFPPHMSSAEGKGGNEYAPWFGIFLRALYEADIVDEEGLLEWRSLSAAKGEGAKDEEEEARFQEVYAKGKQYVDVLEQMDSDDEDEDEEDEDEDEDEDEE